MGSSIFFKYPPDFNFGGKKVLNAGCGFSKFMKPNIVNLDAFDNCKPNAVADLNGPLPFADETFDLVIANHIMEHLTNFWGCFNEFSRVLKTGGRLEIWVPADGSDSQLGFRDHVRIVNLCSFYGTDGTSRGIGNAWAQNELEKYEPCRYMRINHVKKNLMPKRWLKWSPKFIQSFAMEHLRNTIFESGYFFDKISKGDLNINEYGNNTI